MTNSTISATNPLTIKIEVNRASKLNGRDPIGWELMGTWKITDVIPAWEEKKLTYSFTPTTQSVKSIKLRYTVSTPAVENITATVYIDDLEFYPDDNGDERADYSYISIKDSDTADGAFRPYPHNIDIDTNTTLLYINGCVRVKGIIGSAGKNEHITLVSGGTIYIDGSLETSSSSSSSCIALLAKDYVVINQTQVPLKRNGDRKEINLDHLVIFAQDYSFACIPQKDKGSDIPVLNINGCIAENKIYSVSGAWNTFNRIITFDETLNAMPSTWKETLPSSVNLVSLRRK